MRYIIFYFYIAAALLLAGCAKDTAPGTDGGNDHTGAAGDVTVVMSLNVPGASAATRALTAAQEDAVNTIDILAFDKDLKFVDWQYGRLETDGGDVSFSAMLRASSDDADKFRLVVLANVREVTYAKFGNGKFESDYKGTALYADVCALLEAAVPDYGAVEAKGIPMWGELKDPVKLLRNTTNEYDVDLLRSLARIDVGTNPDPEYSPDGKITGWAVLPNFSLEGALVYNAQTHYALTARDAYDFTNKKADTYTLPATTDKAASPKSYSDDEQGNETVVRAEGKGYALTGTIYVGEANVKMGGNYGDLHHTDRMALIVAGKYNGGSDLRYYRIDFAEGTNGATLMDILRGRDYQLVIKSVSGPGKASPDEAINSVIADMTVIVKTWSHAVVDNTVIDGEHYLKAVPYEFEITKWGGTGESVTIETNAPVTDGKSWNATVVGGGTWLTLSGATGGVSGDRVLFDVQPVPGSEPDSFTRSAKLQIAAGNLTYSIVVTQTNRDGEHLLRLSHSELVFDGRKWNGTEWTNPDPQELGINWGPRNNDYGLRLTDYTGGGVDVPSLPEGTDVGSDLLIYSIAPLAIDGNDPCVAGDPFYERSSNLTVSAFDQTNANPITKSVRIRQIFYSLVVTGNEDYYYQGLNYTFNIKSNTAWKATFGGDESIFASRTGTSGSGNTTAGESFRFTISPTAAVGARATVTISSADDSNPRFLPQTFTIEAQDYDLPNSYIVAPGASLTGADAIPVRKAYRVWKFDRDLGGIDLAAKPGVRAAKLLWQDEQGLIAGLPTLSGTGADAVISLTAAAGKTGNAVVAYTIDGEVYWSWHIWVTDYDPDSEYVTYKSVKFMDRNLGAMGNNAAGTAANAYQAYGLYYQWGRKDPFPRAATVTGGALKSIYGESGPALTYNNNGIMSVMAPPDLNLAPSINNPMTYYAGSFGNNSWYGQMIDNRGNLWEDAVKTDFDPCPEGWKVASSTNFSGLSGVEDFTTNRGGIFSNANGTVGFIPATGRIPQQFIGSLNGMGTYSYMATSTRSTMVSILHFRIQNNEYASISVNTSQGNSVRCVKY